MSRAEHIVLPIRAQQFQVAAPASPIAPTSYDRMSRLAFARHPERISLRKNYAGLPDSIGRLPVDKEEGIQTPVYSVQPIRHQKQTTKFIPDMHPLACDTDQCAAGCCMQENLIPSWGKMIQDPRKTVNDQRRNKFQQKQAQFRNEMDSSYRQIMNRQ